MPLNIEVSGAWKNAGQAHAAVSGTWKKLRNVHIGVDGVWKPLWTYTWKTGDWSECSADCGGGTQTRSVSCQRTDGLIVEDVFCDAENKPASSQTCNEQGCEECGYEFDDNATLTLWMVIRLAEFGGINGFSISWEGVNIVSGATPIEATSYVSGGYLYTRSTLQMDTGGITDMYAVCRSPV